jgi:hypothetical protein
MLVTKYSEVDRVVTQIHRQRGDPVSLLSFFKNKDSRLIQAKMNIIYKCEEKCTIAHLTWLKTEVKFHPVY